MTIKHFILFLLSILSVTAIAQRKKIELLGADELEGVTYKKEKANLLNGHVRIKHENSIMSCNKAYMYVKKNNFDAFGNVSIKQRNGLTIYGDSLFYNGDTKIAKIRGNVRVVDKKMTLRTNHLDYNMSNKTAWYYGGGTVNDNGTKLTSNTGFFDSNQDFYSFKGDVKVLKDGSRIEADTLKYATGTSKAYFYGPTHIYTEDKTLYTESGIYNTNSEEGWFSKNAWAETTENKLYGDSLYFNNKTNYGYAINNVKIESYKDSATIYGDVAINDELNNSTKIYGNALMIDRSGGDTTYINADTLVSVEDSTQSKIFAYKNVKIIKGELSGIADSMIYDGLDSTISFFQSPILWSGQSQITGHKIKIILKNEKVDQMHINSNAFIISQNENDTSQFNQIKGNRMLAYFIQNDINQLDVDGNGESIYYAFDNEHQLMGLNSVICSNMKMYLVDNEMDNIRFYDRPIASFIPPQLITEEKTKLRDFIWHTEEKPTIAQLISQSTNRTILEDIKLPVSTTVKTIQTEKSSKEVRKLEKEEKKGEKTAEKQKKKEARKERRTNK